MYKIERTRRAWRPYDWELMLSSYGYTYGRAWTRRGCERALMMEQGRWFAEE
jgi:hypothetical protein